VQTREISLLLVYESRCADESFFSRQFLNIDNGTINTASGTSGAVPTIAAIITLVNDARIAAGKKPVGQSKV
jgi:tripeptidyl-peptidase-1